MPRVTDEIHEAPTASVVSSTPHGGTGQRRPVRCSAFPSLSSDVGDSGGLHLELDAGSRHLELSVLVHGGGGRIRSPSVLSVEGPADVKRRTPW
ncbi:unnamed protein product [Urochloa humidicola]